MDSSNINNDSDPTGSSSETREGVSKRHSLYGEDFDNFDPSEFDDDWQDVFDEADTDTRARTSTGSLGSATSNNTHEDSSVIGDVGNKGVHASPLSAAVALGLDVKEQEGRQGVSLEVGASSKGTEAVRKEENPANHAGTTKQKPDTFSWKNEKEDAVHREKMATDIAQLLFARKKNASKDEKWVTRVKAQSRAFESQLYKNATSLEDYKNIKTLKRRITKLANAFASHFKETKRRRSKRASTTSAASFSSLGSLDANFSNVAVRRLSTASMHSQSSQSSNIQVPTVPGSLMNTQRNQAQNNMLNGNATGVQRSSLDNMNMASGNMMGNVMGGMNDQQQLQQQLLVLQQQQEVLKRQMEMGNSQNSTTNNMMTAQFGMMGNSPQQQQMLMFNQMQQQQNPLTMQMNMMQQQQQNLLQQQAQNQMGFNMLQQNQNPAMVMGNGNMSMAGLNSMGMNMQNVLPGQPNGTNPLAALQSIKTGNPMMGNVDRMSMPPPNN